MRIALITEAWRPQVNGVVTTWTHVTHELHAAGHAVHAIHPGLFRSVPCPRYPSIRLTIWPGPSLTRQLDDLQPDAIHIATEGPLGRAAVSYCRRRGYPFTTSYHTQFPEYLRKYFAVPESWSYAYMRRFHHHAQRVLVPTPSMKTRLDSWNFRHVVVWSRGVDAQLFQPNGAHDMFEGLNRPIFLCAGRVAIEKNLPAFLRASLPGSKVVMGDGPALSSLRRRHPDARFLGYQPREAFVKYLASADVFVFPSRTDTFGLVMLEAMACGVPVAAYPVTGPIDVVTPGRSGVLHEDLAVAAREALRVDRGTCRAEAQRCTWRRCAEQVLENLAVIER